MPSGKDFAYIRQDMSGKTIGMRAGTVFLESFQLSDDMCPAELAETVFVIAGISRMIIAGDNTVKGLAENFAQYLAGPAR